jgi:hypothetical protein
MKLNGALKMILRTVNNLLRILRNLPNKVYYVPISLTVMVLNYKMMDKIF